MLTENDVVKAVANHLRGDGWCIDTISTTRDLGYDILVKKDGMSLAIEAKNETSSKPGPARYGKAFNGNQRLSQVSRALYKSASVFGAGQYRLGIAIPATDRHLKLIKEIKPTLDKLNVSVFSLAMIEPSVHSGKNTMP